MRCVGNWGDSGVIYHGNIYVCGGGRGRRENLIVSVCFDLRDGGKEQEEGEGRREDKEGSERGRV